MDNKLDIIMQAISKQEEQIHIIENKVRTLADEYEVINSSINEVAEQLKKQIDDFSKSVSTLSAKSQKDIIDEVDAKTKNIYDIIEQTSKLIIDSIQTIQRMNEDDKAAMEAIESGLRLILLNSVMDQLP